MRVLLSIVVAATSVATGVAEPVTSSVATAPAEPVTSSAATPAGTSTATAAEVSAVSPCRPPAARPEPALPWLPRLSLVGEDGSFSLWLAWRWPIARPEAPRAPPRAQMRPSDGVEARLPLDVEVRLAADEALARGEALRCR